MSIKNISATWSKFLTSNKTAVKNETPSESENGFELKIKTKG